MASNIPISTGSGAASVATEQIGNNQYQIIKVVGAEAGSTSTMGVNPDRSINVSVIGTVPVTGSIVGLITGIPSISGAVNVAGSVMLGSSNASVITVLQGSSILAIPTGNQSVSGAIQMSGESPASIVTVKALGTQVVATDQGLVSNTVIHGLTSAGGGTYVDVKVDPSGALVTTASSVVTFQGGAWRTSVISSTPSSMLVGASIFGQLPAGTAPIGSVATLQGTNPWVGINVGSIITTNIGSVITVLQSSSLIAVNAGSVVAIPVGSVITTFSQAPSIVGTYLEDAAHATGSRGLFVMQVRNDTMASITSADGDYSPIGGGPVGETITANSPITRWVSGTADMRGGGAASGSSVAVIAAQGASVFTYVTGVQIANFGPSSVLVTLSGATSSVRGYTIAPAGGGSNIVYTNALKTNANGAFSASVSGLSSVLVSAQGFIALI